MVWGSVAIAALFAAMGFAVVVLGIRGKQGQVDYAMGAHTRENFGPEEWTHAHELAGASMILGGGLFVLGAPSFSLLRSQARRSGSLRFRCSSLL